MKYIKLGAQSVPAIGLGTYKLKGPDAIDIMSQALSLGYRHIDTAQLYENEDEVGSAIIESGITRNEIYLTTKVWPSNLSRERFLPSVEESLSKLKTDHVDLLLIHWPHLHLKVEEYMPSLIKARELGYTKEIGVSNFNIVQLKSALKSGAEIVTNQVEFHPWINQTKLHGWMTEHQLPLTAYCPLGQGKFLTDKKLESLSSKHFRSPAQIILRWMMQKDDIIAIPKSNNVKRLADNLNVFDFKLSKTEIEMIDAWRLENNRIVGINAGAKWD